MRPIRETKLQSTCRDLTKQARLLGPDARMPTVRELMTSLPASVTTVNEALRELESRNIIVRKHGVGIFVAPQIKRRNVLVICRSSYFVGTSPYWGVLIEEIRHRAAQSNTMLTLHFTQIHQVDTPNENHSDSISFTPALMEEIESGLVDGVIGIGLKKKEMSWIVNSGEAFVAYAGPGPFTVVTMSQEDMIPTGIDLLIAKGCKDICLWIAYPSEGDPEPEGRRAVQAYKDVLAAHGLACRPDRIMIVDSAIQERRIPVQRQAYERASQCFAGPKETWPDGILSLDDVLTAGILSAMRPKNIVPGRDIAVVTHSNADSPVLLGWEHELTRLEINPYEVVTTLFDLLEEVMSGTPPEEGERAMSLTIHHPA
jgi:DNA-binding LacI/PurR family transcriptional regulator